MRIYLDNAATSYPKPVEVWDAVDRYQREQGTAVGRGITTVANQVQRSVDQCRRRLASLLGVPAAEQIIFCFSGTDALNLVLQGWIRSGDHVITSAAEHNSVLRPLMALKERQGVRVDVVPVDEQGKIDVDALLSLLTSATRLVCIQHASNVTGAIQPLEPVIAAARRRGVRVLVDAAQTAGHLVLNFDELGADFLACSGHKGLLGPLGTGLLCIRHDVVEVLHPLRLGGTGSDSESPRQPDRLPDRYEAGNHNTPGLIGLAAAAEWLFARTVAEIRRHELEQLGLLYDGLRSLSGVTIYGPTDPATRMGVLSFNVSGYAPHEVATILDESFGIEVRAGLHCAPLIHSSLGSERLGGTVRVSLGPFNTSEDVETLCAALRELTGQTEH